MRIKALADFQDGNILAFKVEAGQVIEVSPRESELIAQSGGQFMPVPDDTELTPIAELNAVTTPPLTKKQLEARQLLECQKLEAKQLEETQRFDADDRTSKAIDEKRDLHLTDNDGKPQATRAVEDEVRKRVAQKEAEERQELTDRVTKEAEAEVGKEYTAKSNKPIVVNSKTK